MRRIVILHISLYLCIAYCNAQITRAEIPLSLLTIQSTLAESDTVLTDSTEITRRLEIIFKRRTKERLWQLSECISYLCNNKQTNQKKSQYSRIARKLFSDDAQVFIITKGNLTKEVSVSTFFHRLLSDPSISVVSIDSIMIPKWDYALIKADTLGIIYSNSDMTALNTIKEFGHSQVKLPIVSNETEDGTEWVPLFGSMIVAITYKYEKNRKTNRGSLDAISNKLHQRTGLR